MSGLYVTLHKEKCSALVVARWVHQVMYLAGALNIYTCISCDVTHLPVLAIILIFLRLSQVISKFL
jgi:hypothetical protein